MTGGEIVAAKAATKAAAEIFGEDGTVKKELIEAAKSTPAFKAAADTRARRIAVRQHIMLNLYKPIARMLGVSKAYFDDQFAVDMAAKVDDVPEEHLTQPKASIAAPVMQGLTWSLDEPDLKEMYLNLLATATDDRRTATAHPSFAEIIKQLTAEEAKTLAGLVPQLRLGVTVVRAKKMTSKGTYSPLANNVLDWIDDLEPREPMWRDPGWLIQVG
jgi:demethoxyubiquinone hydroxylase (CLK1/Coq7/Cat5 family)